MDVEELKCIKCKSRTPNKDVQQTISYCKGKERSRVSAFCETCGSKKSKWGSLDKPSKLTEIKKPKNRISDGMLKEIDMLFKNDEFQNMTLNFVKDLMNNK